MNGTFERLLVRRIRVDDGKPHVRLAWPGRLGLQAAAKSFGMGSATHCSDAHPFASTQAFALL